MNAVARSAVLLVWSLFIVYWVVAALRRKRTVKREGLLSRSIVLVLVGIGAQLIFASFASNLPRTRFLPQNAIFDLLAIIAAVAGLLIAVWARRTIGENWSASITVKEGHELIQTGPYRFVRHPIYSGFLLMALASALVPARTRSFVGFLFMLAGFWYKLRQEEKWMTAEFPEQYARYKSRVKALIPWVV